VPCFIDVFLFTARSFSAIVLVAGMDSTGVVLADGPNNLAAESGSADSNSDRPAYVELAAIEVVLQFAYSINNYNKHPSVARQASSIPFFSEQES
jgi:hypothetical protein